MFGCNDEMHLMDDLSWDGGNIHAEVVQIKPFQENEIKKSLVYGSLVFEHIKPTGAKVNLTCIAISLGGVESESIYVDSVAHILPDGYTLDKDRTKVPVYWKMDKHLDAALAGKNLKLFVKEGCGI
jgi:hypothetical protein